ncbi:MAG: AmmeMemoRadiSam system protein B, partial [Planctomycetota bacterium]
MLATMRTNFDSSDILPPGSTAAVADALVVQAVGPEATDEQKAELGPEKLREALDQWIDQALKDSERPSFDVLPRAVVVPHVDYPRGWLNYANVWGRLRVVDRPDRVLVLGTNHFGDATGICCCDKGFRSPLGECPLDRELEQAIRAKLGDKPFENRFDHENEHSIELQIPWIQHCLGANESGAFCPVFGVLVHDPAVNNGASYDGNGVDLQAFLDAMGEALEELGGTTLIVSSADLSHVGPAFGDQQPLAGDEDAPKQFREGVVQRDREMLEQLVANKPDDLVSSMAWQGNPTRWCSVGNLVAGFKLAQPQSVELLNYAAAMDQQGMGMVSSAAMVLN